MSLTGYTPEEIAKIIFTSDIDKLSYYNILANTKDNSDPYFSFEILITILFEGFDILVEGLNGVDIDIITKEHFVKLDPWFNKVGYKINVIQHNKNHISTNHYCKIITNNGAYEMLFSIKNINKNYHFLVNPSHSKNDTLDKIYCIFKNKNNVYEISFSIYE